MEERLEEGTFQHFYDLYETAKAAGKRQKAPEVRAEVVKLLSAPTLTEQELRNIGVNANGPIECYRIRLYLAPSKDLEHVAWVEYALHPDDNPVIRRAIRGFDDEKPFSTWIYTWDDYDVAVNQ